MRSRVLLFMTLLGGVLSLSAQQPTGTPQFNTFQNIPNGIINLGTLDVHLTLPIRSRAGVAGTSFNAAWEYDNELWFVDGTYNRWMPTPGMGVFLGVPVTPGSPASYTVIPSSCNGTPITIWDNFAYTDAQGTQHTWGLSGSVALMYPSCNGVGTSTTATSVDGYLLNASVNPTTSAVTTTVTTPDGTVITGTSSSTTGMLTDRNGNHITVSQSGSTYQYTDTLGTVPLTNTFGSTSSSYTYTNEAGAPESITETYTKYYVITSFNATPCTGISNYNSGSQVALPTRFALPDGSSYQLTWDQISSGYSTARIASVMLPTGGTISFNYNGPNHGINCDGTTSGMIMTTPDAPACPKCWTYTHSAANSNGVATTTVTDPEGNVTKYNFYEGSGLGALETQRQTYTGSSTLLYTVVKCYNGQTTNCATAPTSFSSVTSIATTVIDNANAQNKTVQDYDRYERLTEEDNYDWGSGAPQPSPYRHTYLYYGGYNASTGGCDTLSGNILSVQCKFIVSDPTKSNATDTYRFYIRDAHGNVSNAAQQVSGSYSLYKLYTYNANGTVATFTDV